MNVLLLMEPDGNMMAEGHGIGCGGPNLVSRGTGTMLVSAWSPCGVLVSRGSLLSGRTRARSSWRVLMSGGTRTGAVANSSPLPFRVSSAPSGWVSGRAGMYGTRLVEAAANTVTVIAAIHADTEAVTRRATGYERGRVAYHDTYYSLYNQGTAEWELPAQGRR